MQNGPNAEPTEFKDRRILVTGGTRGIGEAIVDRLIRGGGDVIATPDLFRRKLPLIVLFRQMSVLEKE